MAHNPNPFDFVPFSNNVTTLSREEFDSLGERYNGYLTVQLKTLTPLHIVGSQTGNGRRITDSKFYRQNGTPIIPGSSIKGMLRAFIEAITNGWLSQVNEEYPKIDGRQDKNNGRHIGFRLFDEYPDPQNRPGRLSSKPAAWPNLKPTTTIDKLDIASWMFGHVSTATDKSEADAVRGRVSVEDAVIDPALLDSTYKLPDIDGAAYMGGGKPSASSWWYFSPFSVRKRVVDPHRMAEFVGQKLRGRKFYYHQQPVQCLAWYDRHWKQMNETKNKAKQIVQPPMYVYPVETMKSDKTVCFRVYLKDIPKKLLALLCICLESGKNIRHKLGFGKAYGYGSVELTIKNAMIRPSAQGGWPEQLTDKIAIIKEYTNSPWTDENLIKTGLTDLINMTALKKLSQILGWYPEQNLTFTYPPFNHHTNKHLCFGKPVPFEEAKKVADNISELPTDNNEIKMYVKIDEKLQNLGGKFALELIDCKKTVNLMVYQLKSSAWEQLKSRTP